MSTEPPFSPDENSAPIDFMRGAATGLLIPAHGTALRRAGTEFLTQAFRTFGAMSSDNRVTQITRFEQSSGGSTGQKLQLSLEYARPEPHLHTDLFVKFSRDFNDPIRDNRGKYEMETEIAFAALTRLPGFPIHVPIAHFADYHRASKTGLLISQRIPFGQGGIEPQRRKCLDHELDDPLPYYQAILTALARVAAAHRSGRLAVDVAAHFPYDPDRAAAGLATGRDEDELHTLVARYAAFAAQCPQLLPANIREPLFIAKLDLEVGRFSTHATRIAHFLQSAPDLIALCHWNAHIDNAWFWRDEDGSLQCGLMDWGNVNQMNVAFALWGCLSAAPIGIWDRHLDDLLALFLDELHAQGGPSLQAPELRTHLMLYAALMGLAYFLESPARVLFRLPEAATASGPHDPIFRTSESARANLHSLSVMLNLWQTQDFGGILDRLLQTTP